MRYHKKIYFPLELQRKALNHNFSLTRWSYSKHCLDNIKYRVKDIEDLLNFINELTLDEDNIFEFYTDNGNITKLCYRINWNLMYDIILVVSNTKNIITIYLNSKGDNHSTLDETKYNKEVQR